MHGDTRDNASDCFCKAALFSLCLPATMLGLSRWDGRRPLSRLYRPDSGRRDLSRISGHLVIKLERSFIHQLACVVLQKALSRRDPQLA
jgi:hypothetical protein